MENEEIDGRKEKNEEKKMNDTDGIIISDRPSWELC